MTVQSPHPLIGCVVIGRNEGERLSRCLASVVGRYDAIVYVDSGSADDSLVRAAQAGVEVISLSDDEPFTAARARNAGAEKLGTILPDAAFIQFIDGDCSLAEHWPATALSVMQRSADLAAVCGRRREWRPQASPYNQLCDQEWNTPCGETPTCGGDALVRVAAFNAVGGFRPWLIAGEEPDLCFRMRAQGWKICRIAADMTEHDAAMERFGQWWQRNRRSGFATAEALALRGRHEPQLIREACSNLFWSLPPAWLLWPVLWLRIAMRRGRLAANYMTIGKIPHSLGQIDFLMSKIKNKKMSLIEYK
ncbi:glycosyltransferase family 2 protein [Sphingomonas sp. C3-2]|uniref:glycosyltransferase family 2 protein n=1 Tax=Sphingomonas sp. C3-2 TaxID=3062169 RepID=UPI00294AD8EC|nr:glycosyltransferase [Sphingomonas sp. C3-2]WOK36598.1 glycosyltransferase [Sphingomonas sp. C3-2]